MKAVMTTSKPVSWWSPGWSWKVWGMVVLFLIPTLGFALWVLSQATTQTKIDPPTLSLAQRNSGSEITAVTGTGHTVYHSNKPLPDAKAPQAEGKITLVWFTNSTCKTCQDELFVHRVMADYRENVVFMEKATDRDTSDDRLGVKSVPTFVWLDADGNEMARFGAVSDEAAFRQELDKVSVKNAALIAP
ncbi:MAG: hypothetical protein ABI577_10290 [bacterium]